MKHSPKIVALIVAAGKGTRIGGDLPKQYALLNGKALVAHSVDAFSTHPAIDDIYIVIGEHQEEFLKSALGNRVVAGTVIGGAERHQSVYKGLQAIGAAHHVLIHDAARPLLPAAVIDRLITALETADGAVPVLPVVDTLAFLNAELGDTVDRAALARIQTPQAFVFDAIMTSHQNWQGGVASDDAQMARAAGFRVVGIEGDIMLDKITHPADFEQARARMNSQLISRTGMGYDVHRLESGPELWLCGIRIDHSHGLAGHSDADVALHAITDALLGAIGAGDIGDHFPPSDPQWRGAASHRFADFARDMITSAGGIIDHVDVTIICEAPRIGPHRAAMRTRLAEILQLDEARISVKATTTERLGFTGRGEGIAAQAIATVRSR